MKREVDDAECCPDSKAGRWVRDSLCDVRPWGQSSGGECEGAHLDHSEKEKAKASRECSGRNNAHC